MDNRNNSSENKVSQKKEYLWDRDEIITMTDTSMSAVLGDRYKQADEYPIRARMPLPPFLFISEQPIRIRRTACHYKIGSITEKIMLPEKTDLMLILRLK